MLRSAPTAQGKRAGLLAEGLRRLLTAAPASPALTRQRACRSGSLCVYAAAADRPSRGALLQRPRLRGQPSMLQRDVRPGIEQTLHNGIAPVHRGLVQRRQRHSAGHIPAGAVRQQERDHLRPAPLRAAQLSGLD